MAAVDKLLSASVNAGLTTRFHILFELKGPVKRRRACMSAIAFSLAINQNILKITEYIYIYVQGTPFYDEYL